MRLLLATICMMAFFAAPAFAGSPEPASLSSDPDDFIARVLDETETKFTLEAIAPNNSVMEFAICKAVEQAEKKGAESMSLGDPKFSVPPKIVPGTKIQIPDDWSDLKATVWLTNPNPSGMPAFNVASKALACSHTWDWFRDENHAAAYPSKLSAKNVEFKGKTTADAALVNSVFSNIMSISVKRLKCGSATQVTQEILPATYKPGGETFDNLTTTTFEKWTPTLCGREISFLVGFWPAADGGTMFRVVLPFPAQAQQ
ncbi:MAG TPA: hypothetical protein VL625_13280 [Patescibacteria group bacterium]|nr:hypothetical protein [Patescibacteria group bacterium]